MRSKLDIDGDHKIKIDPRNTPAERLGAFCTHISKTIEMPGLTIRIEPVEKAARVSLVEQITAKIKRLLA